VTTIQENIARKRSTTGINTQLLPYLPLLANKNTHITVYGSMSWRRRKIYSNKQYYIQVEDDEETRYLHVESIFQLSKLALQASSLPEITLVWGKYATILFPDEHIC